MTYTLAFENSTNYLTAYVLNGTEYCCASSKTCVTEGLECGDGSLAQLTWAQSGTYYSGDQIYEPDQFPVDFFGPYCPFNEAQNDDGSSNVGGGDASDGPDQSTFNLLISLCVLNVFITFAITILCLRNFKSWRSYLLSGSSAPSLKHSSTENSEL